MKKFKEKIGLFLSICSLLIVSSCEREECETCNLPPIINEQFFELKENSQNGKLIGTITAEDPDRDQKLIYKIISGNFDNAFKLDSISGELFVNDSSLLDFEKRQKFELSVKVTDDCNNPISASTSVMINLLDVTPSLEGLVSYYTFQNSVEDLIGSNEGIANDIEYFTDFTNSQNTTVGFNGFSSYVNLQSSFDFPEMTINLWFLAKEFDTVFDLIYTSDNPSLQYGLTSIAIRKDNGVDNLYFNVSGQNVTVQIEKDTWYNLSIVRDNREFKYYLNNDIINNGIFNNYLTSSSGSQFAVVGCVRTLQGGFLKGNVDNLRIYNRALMKEELAILYAE